MIQKVPRTVCSLGLLGGLLAAAGGVCAQTRSNAGGGHTLPGTHPLTTSENISVQMVHGISRFLDREIAASKAGRARFWQPDYSTRAAYEKSVAPNRERLARMIGAIDPQVPDPQMEYVASVAMPAQAAETDRFVAYRVRWRVFDGVYGEGLLLQPKGKVVARVIAVPDADQIPEVIAGLRAGLNPDSQYARRLAENGCEVMVPTLFDRSDRFSQNPEIKAVTNQPHREFIYRQGYVLGRHVIGIEVQKLRSALDWFSRQDQATEVPLGVVGWGEGGLLAFYTAALDPRVDSVLVSGYFGKREQLWSEPMYRNVFGLLVEFGDAEIARLIVPRTLVIEPAAHPLIKAASTRAAPREPAAAGRLEPPAPEEVSAEASRARQLAGPYGSSIRLLEETGADGPLSGRALLPFLQSLDSRIATLHVPGRDPRDLRTAFDGVDRQRRQVQDTGSYLQRLIPLSAKVREDFLWSRVQPTTPEAWREAMRPYREVFWTEAIGRFRRPAMPLNPRSRLIHDEPAWTAHEVMLDVFPDVVAWGYYLLPKGIKPGERRPVVVVQHGGGGMPADVMNENPEGEGYRWYKAFARRLVERGFIVFAPHMLNGGHDRLPNRPSTKLLQRKANIVGRTLTSVAVAQHDAMLDWLGDQREVDAQRIAFYGLSYGGKAAMRIPAILDRFALSICSADFNEWIWKSATTDFRASNVFGPNFDVMEFNLGSTFGYAEMAALIAPRPFMVERGHNDGVGIDEWVAFEYARVRRLYAKLKIPGRTEIEYFDGPHTIHGVGTFKFLHRHLDWPDTATANVRLD